MTAPQEQPAATTTGAEAMSDDDTTPDYALPYGQRVPTSYDAEAAASLIAAEAAYIEANGGRGFLAMGEAAALKAIIVAWARQFRSPGGITP